MTAILFGAPICGIWYWCTDRLLFKEFLQQKMKAARKATIFAGFLKLTPMFIFVVPCMIAYAMHNDPTSAFKLPVENGEIQSSGTLAAKWSNIFFQCPRGLIAAAFTFCTDELNYPLYLILAQLL